MALFSTTGIQHKWTQNCTCTSTGSIWSQIDFPKPVGSHIKTSFPLYADSIVDCCSGLSLSQDYMYLITGGNTIRGTTIQVFCIG